VDFYLNTAFPAPAVTTVHDQFLAYNHFYGGQFGGTITRHFGNAFVSVGGVVAMGATHEEVKASGVSALHVGPVGPVSQTGGGIYVQNSNAERRENDAFAVIPELDVKVGYQFNNHLSVNVGYTFMYWSEVVRPGDQIDHNVNGNRVPVFLSYGLPGG